MKHKNYRYLSRGVLTATLAGAMVFTPVAGIGVGLAPTVRAEEAATAGGYLNLEQMKANGHREMYVGTDWSGAQLELTEQDTGAHFEVKNFGWANSEWALQYVLNDLDLQAGVSYEVEADITASRNKSVFVKLSDSGMIESRIDLVAGETYHFQATSKPDVAPTTAKLFFALGQFTGEEVSMAGAMDINNIRIKNLTTGAYLTVPEKVVVEGSEYDFSKDNSDGDVADPGTVKEGYDLIWADEFDGNYGDATVDANTGLNLNNWAYQLGDGSTDCGNYGWGNNELQAYTNRKQNVAVNEDLTGDGTPDGLLRITASREDNGYVYAGESAKNYTSARLRSTTGEKALFNTTYGYIEARMSLPATAGAWPAFWMLPESTTIYGGWPVSGEIDIMESCGAFADGAKNKAAGTLHWGAPEHVYKGSGNVNLDSDTTYFHTYAVDWEPGKMVWYFDGKPVTTRTNWNGKISGATADMSYDAPFDQPFYMLLNLAVDSGQFGGDANKAQFVNDINMYVDYVRVFQKSGGYPDSVVKVVDNNGNSDWAQFEGINQIAEITTSNVAKASAGGGMDDAAADPGMWYLSHQSDATDATFDTVERDGNAYAKVGVKTAGGQDYSVQLIGHYNAKEGYVYRVSYDTFADGGMVGKTVNCDSKEWHGWSTYGIQSFELTEEPSHNSFLFEQGEDFDNCRIEFNVGSKGSGNVYIGNVKVEIVDPAELQKEADVRNPSTKGDFIYNGSFDQGNHHVGYWSASEGTTLSVPRYTTTDLTGSDKRVVDVASKSNYEQIENGVKYYERRAQISGDGNVRPQVYQSGLVMPKDAYHLTFDLYSAKETAVTAAVYEMDGDKLGKRVAAGRTTVSAGKVNTFTWDVTTTEDIADAAVVFTFEKDAKVQLDNVSFIGANQGAAVEAVPLGDKQTWEGDNGGGGKFAIQKDGEVYYVENAASGNAWYAPQIISNDFTLTEGNRYRLTFDYKMEGNSNNRFDYIVQENGGGWYAYQDVKALYVDEATQDADGFNHEVAEFDAGRTLSTVHVVLGLGNSQASGDLKFSFKNVKLELVTAGGNDGSAEGNRLEDVTDEEEPEVEPTTPSEPTAPSEPTTPSRPSQPSQPATQAPAQNTAPTANPAPAPAATPAQAVAAQVNQGVTPVVRAANRNNTTTTTVTTQQDSDEEEELSVEADGEVETAEVSTTTAEEAAAPLQNTALESPKESKSALPIVAVVLVAVAGVGIAGFIRFRNVVK
ncbi:MAG: glycoside hydrolase family 16 protein [Lachnospiraceae bacterium]|nr:glycoside hydrolase family 16 protein [Lachnospiraceae bacterium]